MATRKEREMLQRKMEIVDAAQKLFIQKEYENVTMAEIAREAEFTRRTIYLYFKSKIDLVVEVFLKVFAKGDVKFEEAIENAQNDYDKLFAFGKAYYQFFKGDPAYYKLLHYFDLAVNNEAHKLSPTVLEDINSSNINIEIRIEQVIQDGMSQGHFRDDLNVKLAVTFFLKSLYGIIHQYILHPKFPDEYFYEELRYLLRAFENREK